MWVGKKVRQMWVVLERDTRNVGVEKAQREMKKERERARERERERERESARERARERVRKRVSERERARERAARGRECVGVGVRETE